MKKDDSSRRSPSVAKKKPDASAKTSTSAAKAPESNPIPDIFEPMRKAVEGVRPKNSTLRWAGLALFALLLVQVFLTLLSMPSSALIKFALSAVLFMVGGEIMRAWMGWDGFWGLILFKDRSTLAWIDRQAQRYASVWNVLADLGLVMGYGLCSYFLLGPQARKPRNLVALYAVGMSLLIIFASFIAPVALTVMGGMVANNDFHAASSYVRGATLDGLGSVDILGNHVSLVTILVSAALLIGGLAATTLVSLSLYAIVVTPPVFIKLFSVALSLLTGKVEGNHYVPPPGGSPLLPGINLPFVEGILALAVLLVVHEMSHGLLARIAKIRLDSAGIVFFGILPFGAFVEPDEKELDAVPAWQANRVLVAGSTANLLTAIAAFLLLVAFIGFTAPYRLEGWRMEASGPVPAGAMVYAVNGTAMLSPEMRQNLSLHANQSIMLTTSRGTYQTTTNKDGYIGLGYVYQDASGFRYQYAPGWEWMSFVANLLGLIFALDVLVGIVNLLPIPLFDGHRLMVNGVNWKFGSDAVGWIATGAFVLNFLPWIFK